MSRIDKGLYWDRGVMLVEGCTPVSESGEGQDFSKVSFHIDRLWRSAKHRTPQRIAIRNDLFHEAIQLGSIDDALGIVARNQQHQFLVSTKHAKPMFDYLSVTDRDCPPHFMEVLSKWTTEECVLAGADMETDPPWPLPNLWLGVTAENQRWADERIPYLLRTPAAVRYVSVEPMLGPVDLSIQLDYRAYTCTAGEEANECICGLCSYYSKAQGNIDLVIIGCESNGAHLGRMGEFGSWEEWLNACYELINQCVNAGVKVFVKQIPRFTYGKWRLSKDMAEWPAWARRRELPKP